MDAKQFDSIARALAGQASRRVLAGGFASGALGAALHLLPQSAEAAKRKKQDERENERVAAEKKRKKKKKKVTLCQNGETIKVNKKAKKKFLRLGATTGACQPIGCVENPNACAGRECGTVNNNCIDVSCGECTNSEICNTNTGQCESCTPIQNPCGDRVCGSVDNGCGTLVQCGPDNGNCPGAPDECRVAGVCGNDGQCSFPDAPDDTPCGMNKCNRTCQSGVCTNTPVVCPDDTACEEYTCDPNDGTCSATPKVCPPAPECQAGAGVCNPQTGECSYTAEPNDTPCGMNKCNRTCQEGVCEQVPVVCPPAGECQASICDPNFGTCSAPVAANQGGACNSGAGMCVNGICEVTNTGSNSCTSANPCLVPTFCNASGTCICYSSIEGAGFCIDQTQAICPSADIRPACASSDECAESEVCVPLKETPDSSSSCCPSGQFPGFCVPLSARCAQA